MVSRVSESEVIRRASVPVVGPLVLQRIVVAARGPTLSQIAQSQPWQLASRVISRDRDLA